MREKYTLLDVLGSSNNWKRFNANARARICTRGTYMFRDKLVLAGACMRVFSCKHLITALRHRFRRSHTGCIKNWAACNLQNVAVTSASSSTFFCFSKTSITYKYGRRVCDSRSSSYVRTSHEKTRNFRWKCNGRCASDYVFSSLWVLPHKSLLFCYTLHGLLNYAYCARHVPKLQIDAPPSIDLYSSLHKSVWKSRLWSKRELSRINIFQYNF